VELSGPVQACNGTALQSNSDLNHLTVVVSRSLSLSLSHTHTHTHTHPVGLPCINDQPVAQTSTCTTHNKHNRQTSMPAAGFEPGIPTDERPQTYALDCTATGIGHDPRCKVLFILWTPSQKLSEHVNPLCKIRGGVCMWGVCKQEMYLNCKSHF
jgi:hypothetical protein